MKQTICLLSTAFALLSIVLAVKNLSNQYGTAFFLSAVLCLVVAAMVLNPHPSKAS